MYRWLLLNRKLLAVYYNTHMTIIALKLITERRQTNQQIDYRNLPLLRIYWELINDRAMISIQVRRREHPGSCQTTLRATSHCQPHSNKCWSLADWQTRQLHHFRFLKLRTTTLTWTSGRILEWIQKITEEDKDHTTPQAQETINALQDEKQTSRGKCND